MTGCFEKIILNLHQRLDRMQAEAVRHEWIKQKIKNSEVFVCFITKNFIKDKRRREECELALSLNRVMYAVVKKGTRWKKFKKYPWRKIYYFEKEEDLNGITMEINKDVDFVRKAGGR